MAFMASVQMSSRDSKNSRYLARKISVSCVLGRLTGEPGQRKCRVSGKEEASFSVCLLF